MQSAGHRTAFAHIGQAPDVFGLKFKSYDFNGDRPYDVWKEQGTFENLYTNRPMPIRAMFYESNCHRWEATCICRSTYWICIDISLVKTKILNSIKYVALEERHATKNCYWNICNLEQVLFSHPSLSESASVFLFLTTCFFWGMMANFDIIVYIIARENVFHPCKIDRASYGVRLISYNAVRGIGRWYHIQTPAAARTICYHLREIS